MNFGKYIAHRGLHDINRGVPENSMPAFKLACEKNLAIELDVQLTKDGRIVVFHDRDLTRMCGAEANLSDFTYEQLQTFSLSDTSEKIPLLADVLKLIDGRVPLMIELKSANDLFSLEKRLKHIMKKYSGEYSVASFDPFSLLWFRVFSPKAKRCQLISKFSKDNLLKRLMRFSEPLYLLRLACASPLVWRFISKPDIIACDLRSVSLQSAFQTVDCGADFITWTANSEELMETAKQFSKSVIFEELPDSFDFSDNYSDEN